MHKSKFQLTTEQQSFLDLFQNQSSLSQDSEHFIHFLKIKDINLSHILNRFSRIEVGSFFIYDRMLNGVWGYSPRDYLNYNQALAFLNSNANKISSNHLRRIRGIRRNFTGAANQGQWTIPTLFQSLSLISFNNDQLILRSREVHR